MLTSRWDNPGVTRALALLLVLTTAIAVGCGVSDRPAASMDASSHRLCDPTGIRGFRTCENDTFPLSATIEHRTGSSWHVVTGPLPHPESAASWHVVSLSPDRRILLAEWTYPCDSAAVVFVPVRHGSPWIATGEKDWRKAPIARALGWTSNGKARVRIYTNWRGHRMTPMHPRTFLIDPNARVADPHPARRRGC